MGQENTLLRRKNAAAFSIKDNKQLASTAEPVVQRHVQLTMHCDNQSMQSVHGHDHDGLSSCMSSMQSR